MKVRKSNRNKGVMEEVPGVTGKICGKVELSSNLVSKGKQKIEKIVIDYS